MRIPASRCLVARNVASCGRKGGGYTREMGTICPFGVFPLFYNNFLLQNWPFLLQNVVFWELEKAIFGPEKDKWWIWGSKAPKTPEMPIKQGKTSQHHNWPRYMDWPQSGPKIAIKQGKKRQKDKWYPFRAPTGTGGWGVYVWGESTIFTFESFFWCSHVSVITVCST